MRQSGQEPNELYLPVLCSKTGEGFKFLCRRIGEPPYQQWFVADVLPSDDSGGHFSRSSRGGAVVKVPCPTLTQDYFGCPHCGDKTGFFQCFNCGNLCCQGNHSSPNFVFCPQCKTWAEVKGVIESVEGTPGGKALASPRPNPAITSGHLTQSALPASNPKPQVAGGSTSGSLERGKQPSLPPRRRF
jgi:hypothetical protein